MARWASGLALAAALVLAACAQINGQSYSILTPSDYDAASLVRAREIIATKLNDDERDRLSKLAARKGLRPDEMLVQLQRGQVEASTVATGGAISDIPNIPESIDDDVPNRR